MLHELPYRQMTVEWTMRIGRCEVSGYQQKTWRDTLDPHLAMNDEIG